MLWEKLKSSLSRFIPRHVNDPFGLIGRMLKSKKRAAVFTLWLTGLGVLLTPVDMLLQFFEKRRQPERVSNGPHIIICGPARSGTTLVYQMLADALPVSYIRNFTVMFSRAPITTSKWFSRNKTKVADKKYENYYGKTAGFQSPSEANHLWNQWVDADPSGFRTIMTDEGGTRMARFFEQFSSIDQMPTLSKNNNANAFADVIAEHLDNTYFICLKRDSRYLAQSLITARMEINGNINQNYGVTNVAEDDLPADPIREVVEQIQYLDNLAVGQQARLGADRFWLIDYEAFCNDPEALVARVRSEILKGFAEDQTAGTLQPLKNNNKITNPELFEKLNTVFTER